MNKWEYYLNKYRNERDFDPESWIYDKCVKFNDYLTKSKLTGSVLSISGGIDSAVTLGLLKYTKGLENSNLKKIYAVSQPIHSSNWAYERAKELCIELEIEMITIDQTEIHNQITDMVEKKLNYKSNDFSRGQLKSYIRTPINYYLAQTLSEQGYPAIVMGTGNMDEDGYLAYFCKYGDGAVDVQLISDLHKSEVFKVGKYLSIPESILNAAPSADLWEGQEDEQELGFSYDFIEFYTGYYLKLDDNSKNELLERLDDNSKKEFNEYSEKCVMIHNRNKHKINGVVNL